MCSLNKTSIGLYCAYNKCLIITDSDVIHKKVEKVWQYFGILKNCGTNFDKNLQPITWSSNSKNTGTKKVEKMSPKKKE